MNKREMKVGQKVYLEPSSVKINRGAPPIVEGTIIRIGRKYYTVRTEHDIHSEYKFDIESLEQRSEYSPDYLFYFDKQELLDEKEIDLLRRKLSRFFEWSGQHKNLTLDQLRRINAILEESDG